MRCLALADGLKSDGHRIKFVMRPQLGDLTKLINSRGFEVALLPKLKTLVTPKHQADYDAWLQVSQEQDSLNFIELIEQADLVIVDHYGIGIDWENRIIAHFQCQLAVIDDLLRSHSCDLLIDQTLGRKPDEYRNLVVPQSCILTGSEYALLKKDFSRIRKRALNKSNQSPHKILITMGGIDSLNVTTKVLEALIDYKSSSSSFSDNIEFISVVINPQSPSYQQVIEVINPHLGFIKQFDFVDNMAELMLEHTLSIGAPGATSWERACLGLPSVIIPLAENQREVCQALVERCSAIKVELKDLSNNEDQTFSSALTELINNYEVYRRNALLICDGLGVKRLQAQFRRLAESTEPNSRKNGRFFRCRLAEQADVELVFLWQKLPETRRFALNPKIPSYKEHVAWMEAKLNSTDNYFYIIEVRKTNNEVQQAGVLRLDKIDKCSGLLVSVFIEPEQHGKGLAGQALSEI
ncbi:MAG: UDP-2,4-diacetamido-2,4,6-trideoxy-beta-L-altropyranose hydrolase, partial [Kangiellaceae bacterium]